MNSEQAFSQGTESNKPDNTESGEQHNEEVQSLFCRIETISIYFARYDDDNTNNDYDDPDDDNNRKTRQKYRKK